MSKRNLIIATVALVVMVLTVALFAIASQTNWLLSGDYYVKVDNAQISENDSTGGVINLKSSEPYLYELDAVNEAGEEATIEFGVSRELRQDAYLKLEVQPVRGVISWSEVSEEELPQKAAEALR